MKTATYPLRDGTKLTVEYDERAPCIGCGLPVVEASMGGTVLCPWCDTGHDRKGKPLAYFVRPSTPEERAVGKGSIVFDIPKATPEEYAAAVETYWPSAAGPVPAEARTT